MFGSSPAIDNFSHSCCTSAHATYSPIIAKKDSACGSCAQNTVRCKTHIPASLVRMKNPANAVRKGN